MHETRVNLKHLLEDIKDGYGLPIAEAILVELVANSLDSRASKIDFFTSPAEAKLTVCDNGQGIKRSKIKEYHNIATTTKIRGKGIGFAGIGAKLSLLIAKSVITETKGGHGSHCATFWYLMDENRAPWKFIPPDGRLSYPKGTAVTIELFDPQSPLLSADFIAKTIKCHFYPLLHPQITDSILKYFYKNGVNFFINGKKITLGDFDFPGVLKTFQIILGKRQIKLAGFGFLVKTEESLPKELWGLGISTFGKVIKRGWEWIGIFPKSSARIYGMVETPALSEILTTHKNDFLKDAASLKKYYRYRKSIQEAITPILDEFGEERLTFEKDLRRLRPLEKEIERVLRCVLEDFPELTPLVGVRKRVIRDREMPEQDLPRVEIYPPGEMLPPEEPKEISEILEQKPKKERAVSEKKKIPTLAIGFEKNPSQIDLARVVKNTIWVNTLHPAYLKSHRENSEEYHIFLCVAWALSQFIEEDRSPQEFISQFLASWSQDQDNKRNLEIFKE